MGKVATRYSRRIAAAGRGKHRLRGDIGKVLVEALEQATDEQLYDVTTLPTTGKMRRSIQPYFLGNDEVAVGYNRSKAKHVRRRLNMKGRSPSGGHDLTMRPAPVLRRIADPKIRRLTRDFKSRALAVS